MLRVILRVIADLGFVEEQVQELGRLCQHGGLTVSSTPADSGVVPSELMLLRRRAASGNTAVRADCGMPA
eukprot:5116205-Ditylum_brightwellii.AAC.1